MKLLAHDIDRLKEEHPQAYAFITAARLRSECQTLLGRNESKVPLSKWENNRLLELLETPACYNDSNFMRKPEAQRARKYYNLKN
jgi:hypothetical protein